MTVGLHSLGCETLQAHGSIRGSSHYISIRFSRPESFPSAEFTVGNRAFPGIFPGWIIQRDIEGEEPGRSS